MSAITIAGDLVHYEVLGRGRPVVLLHGWLGSWRYWIPLMQQLHLKYRVYAIDMFGFGDSGKNPEKYSIPEQVNLLESFMKELGIPKAAFIGHGYGAMVIIAYASQYPTKVARALLSSLPMFDPGGLPERNPAGFQVPLKPVDPKILASQPVMSQPTTEATVTNPKMIDRDRLRSAAGSTDKTLTKRPNKTEDATNSDANPLEQLFEENTLQSLLAKCFKKNEAAYEKLLVDVEKADKLVLDKSAGQFDSIKHLDSIRLLKMPIALIHGADDPFMPAPTEDVWGYLTLGRENSTVAIPLPNIRHFPMLEHEPFPRLATDFLETPDIKELAIRERWQRRSR